MKFRNKIFVSKKNRIGIIVLALISIVVIFFPRILILIKGHDNSFSITCSESKNWNLKDRVDEKKYQTQEFYFKKTNYKVPPKRFDPNQYSKSDWMNLGLSEKQVNVILKFTKRGISSNEDLKRIFVISDELYNLIKDSTFYKERIIEFHEEISTSAKVNITLIEINDASEDDLLKVKGIGPFFAKQIIKKRNEFGGFVSKDQLLEVWKMDQEKYEMIKDYLEVDTKKVIKISLNSSTVEELKQHPYIRWNIANSIVKMREQKNGFKSIEELKESVLITNEKFEKLKPYLSL